MKIFVKPELRFPMESYTRIILEQRAILANVPNTISYANVLETEKAVYLVRQFLHNSLYDRIRLVSLYFIV